MGRAVAPPPGAGLTGGPAEAGGGSHGCHHRGGQERREVVGVDGRRLRKGGKVHALVAPPACPWPWGLRAATTAPHQRAGGAPAARGRECQAPDEAGGAVHGWRLRGQGDLASSAPASRQEQHTSGPQAKEEAQAWQALLPRLAWLPCGQGGGGALLRLARGMVPQAGPALRAKAGNLRRLRPPGLLPHRLESSEMSSHSDSRAGSPALLTSLVSTFPVLKQPRRRLTLATSRSRTRAVVAYSPALIPVATRSRMAC